MELGLIIFITFSYGFYHGGDLSSGSNDRGNLHRLRNSATSTRYLPQEPQRTGYDEEGIAPINSTVDTSRITCYTLHNEYD